MRTLLSTFTLAALASVTSAQCVNDTIDSASTGTLRSGSYVAASDEAIVFMSDAFVTVGSLDAAGVFTELNTYGGVDVPGEVDAFGSLVAFAPVVSGFPTVYVEDTSSSLAPITSFSATEAVDVAITTNSGGDWLAIGRPDAGSSGVVDLWNRPTSGVGAFSLTTTLTAPANDTAGMRFGSSVALSGDTLVMSAPLGDQGAPDGGNMYIYRWNGTSWVWNSWWVGGTAGEQRHAVVATNGNSIIAGAPDADNGGPDAGTVTFFEFDGSIFVPTTAWQVGNDGARWGSSVDIDGDVAVIGSANGEFARRGFHDGTNWIVDFTEFFGAPGAGGDFADGVAVVDGVVPRFYLGQPGFNADEGGVHQLIVDQTSAATDLGNGLAGTFGVPVLASDTCNTSSNLTLTTSGMPFASTFAIVIGFSTLNIPFKGGTLVPSPDQLITGLPTGAGTLPLAGPIPPGLDGFSLFFQSWIVDGAAPNGLSASNGLRIEFFE